MDTRTLQIALATLGFNCPVDGIFNAATAAALRDFQRNLDLPISGEADTASIDALERLRHAWETKGYPSFYPFA